MRAFKGREPAWGACLALSAGLALACGAKGTQSREIEPGVREIRNSHGRFLFLERKSWAEKGMSGLGIRIAEGPRGLEIVEVFGDGPAKKAGIQPGELVDAIDGARVRGLGVEEAARRIRGKPGSAVVLALKSSKGSRTLTLKRDARYVPFADFPEGTRTKALPEGSFGGRCPDRTEDGCLSLIQSEGSCYFSCK